MASYNHENYISQAIESVLNQTFSDIELVIVDDASQDTSQQIINNYVKKDKRVKAILHKKNQGISKTSNECLLQANGKFVAFIGSDDVWEASKLEKQLNILEKNEDKLLWSEGIIIDSLGKRTGEKVTELLEATGMKKSGYLFQDLMQESYIFGQSLIFKTEFLEGLSFYEDLKYLSDHKFYVDLAKNHSFLFSPQPLAQYRVHGKNVSFKDKIGWLKDRILVRKYFLQEYGNIISRETKADLYLRIGHCFSKLEKKAIAWHCYLQAVIANFFHLHALRNLAYALLDRKGSLSQIMLFLSDALFFRVIPRSKKSAF